MYLLGIGEVRSRHGENYFTMKILLDLLTDTNMLHNGEKLMDIPVMVNIKSISN